MPCLIVAACCPGNKYLPTFRDSFRESPQSPQSSSKLSRSCPHAQAHFPHHLQGRFAFEFQQDSRARVSDLAVQQFLGLIRQLTYEFA